MNPAYQILFWRDIPAQVRSRDDDGRFSQPLTMRFQLAIDEAATRAGLTGTDDYLNEWHSSDWQNMDGDPESIAKSVAAEIEVDYTQERLESLVRNEGIAK